MKTKLSGFADFKGITQRVAIGAFLGLAWGTSLRAWMVLLTVKIGNSPQFTWSGTFGGILIPAALMGAMLGRATYSAEGSGTKWWRWATLLPLLLVLGPVIFTNNFITSLITTGMGGGAIGVALIGMLGGYAFSGFGARWTRWVSGLLSFLLTIGIVIFYVTAGPAAVTPGVDEAFGALLFALLMALLIAGVSAPSRYRTRQPISS